MRKISLQLIPLSTALIFCVCGGLQAQDIGNTGSLIDSNIGSSITSGESIFSTPLPSPSLGGTADADASGTGTSGNTGTTGATQTNTNNPFGADIGAATGGNTGRNQNPFSAFGNMFNNKNLQQAFGGQNQQKRIPTRMVVKFDHPSIPTSNISISLKNQLKRLPWPDVVVSVENRVATVLGTVASSDTRLLVERYVSMEPGISEIKNELVVVPSPKK